MIPNKRPSRDSNGSVWEPVHDILEGVEQAVAGGWYPARRLLLSRQFCGDDGPWNLARSNDRAAAQVACGGGLSSVWFPDLRKEQTTLSFGLMVKF